MKFILITGSNGFVGKLLKKKLDELNYKTIEFEGDILDPQCYEALSNMPISHCFHLAAKTFVPESWANTESFLNTNVFGTQKILDFCHLKKVPLTFVSAYLYGIPESLPISEADPIKPNNPYALSKQLAENLCRFYATYNRLKVTVIRPFNIYGPGQNSKFLIPSIVHQALHDPVIQVKDLTPKRDYVFIDDLIDALVLTIDHSLTFSVYNIASGSSLSVKEVIDIIQQAAKTKKEIVSEEESRPNEIPDTVANVALAKSELGWVPKHTFMDGITKMIHHYKG